MSDLILWEYLDELLEQETAWYEWYLRLVGWHCFNTFYIHFLRVEHGRAKFLECMTPCEYGCPRHVVENSPSDIMAVCTHDKAVSIHLKFRDILIYSLRYEVLHHELCSALKILPTEYSVCDYGNIWHLGDYYAASSKVYYPVYLTYRTTSLTEIISSLCQLCPKPFVLMTPTGRELVPEVQQLLAANKSILLYMEAELSLQSDGSFKSVRSISECMKSYKYSYPQSVQNKMLPI